MAGALLAHASTGFIRASIVCFFLRLEPLSRRLRTALRAILSTVVIVGIIAVLSVIFRCIPVKEQWSTELNNPKKRCLDGSIQAYILPACMVALNLLIYTAPLPLLWNLKLPVRQRVGLIAAYQLGSLGVIGCILQLVYSKRLMNTKDPFCKLPPERHPNP